MPENEKTNIARFAVWLNEDLISRMDGWLEADDCKNRSEFISKALQFYMGFLAAEDTTPFLAKVLVDIQRGIAEDNANRISTLLFKLCVEVNMLCHTMAAHYQDDPLDCRALRKYAVDEVKRTNGRISLDKAAKTQRRLDDEWQE